MPDLEEIRAIKRALIHEWSAPRRGDWNASPILEASLDAVELPDPHTAGLAVGHSVFEDGSTQVDLRVTASAGPNWSRARKFQLDLQQRGIRADLVEIAPPIFPAFVLNPKAAAGQDDRAELDEAEFGGRPRLPDRRRPLQIGASIGHERGGAGTIGGFVRLPDGSLGVLSCCHVLALGGLAEIGDRIYQPAIQDSRQLADEHVAKLSGKFPPLAPGLNALDAAVARLNDGVAPDGMANRLPRIDGVPVEFAERPIGELLEIKDLRNGQEVVKLGRSSGFTVGRVTSVDVDNFAVAASVNGATGRYSFSNVTEIVSLDRDRPFATKGDSGALVLRKSDLRPIGIHFLSVTAADTQVRNYLMPIERIRDMLKVTLI